MENPIENHRGGLSRVIRSLLFAVGAAFIILLLIHGRNEFQSVMASANWAMCSVSIVLVLASNFISAFAFSAFLSKHGGDMKLGAVTRMLMYGQVTKYIPGKFWGLIYQATHFEAALPGFRIIALTNLELMMVGVIANAAIAVGLLVLFSYPLLSGLSFLIGLLLSFFLYTYRGYQPVLNVLQRWIPNFGVDERAAHSSKGMIYVGGYYISVWVFSLTGAFLMIAATMDLSFQQTAITIAVMNVAWIVSIVIFIFPAGIGIREIVFVWLTYELEVGIPLEHATVIAVLFRFWQVTLDILGAASVWLAVRILGR